MVVMNKTFFMSNVIYQTDYNFSMTSLYNQNRASLKNFTILTTHCIAQLSPSELSKSLIVICYKGDQEKEKKKKTSKMDARSILRMSSVYHFIRDFHYFYTLDLHILPSNEITIIETSSWYLRRSPCGISSNS